FGKDGKIALDKKENLSAKMSEELTVLAYSEDMGKVLDDKAGYFMLGYDDVYSIQYFEENYKGYWAKNGDVSIIDAFKMARDDYSSIMERCDKFNRELMNDAYKAGGTKYMELCALVYRQVVSAHKLIEDKEGTLLFLSKENNSNGSIGTVDISYPSSPLFLVYNTELAKGLMNHIIYYSESGKWTKPFPAHDIGTYPIGNGLTYGGDMPIEESGNMLIMAGAIATMEGNAEYAKKHWDLLTTWTNYMVEHGLDPENQLCTDDFAGHLAHNTNLSIKAIMGIASYSKLADMLGYKDTADKYFKIASEMAVKWEKMANDKDHYRLAFDKPGTWSMKYNLVWDKLLGFNIFNPAIATTELAYYRTKNNKYGLPLDNRADYTKTDWMMWTAILTGEKDDFDFLVDMVYKYADETVSRVPISDWHNTITTERMNFKARSVVGGYYIKMLEDKIKGLQKQ
ncbi:MAG: glutaminase domain-containing protein, partial [Fermentimonas sp.]